LIELLDKKHRAREASVLLLLLLLHACCTVLAFPRTSTTSKENAEFGPRCLLPAVGDFLRQTLASF